MEDDSVIRLVTEQDFLDIKNNISGSRLNTLKVKFVCSVCNNEAVKGYRSTSYPFLCKSCRLKKSAKNACEKRKATSLARYGTVNAMKSEVFKNKCRQTCIEKYGVDNYSKTKEYKEQVVNTSISRYGVSNYSKTTESIERRKNTCLEKYGVSNYNKLPEAKEKIRNTVRERYGYDYISQVPEFIEKSRDAFDKSILLNHQAADKNFVDFKNGYFTIHCEQCNSDYTITSVLYNNRLRNKTVMCTKCNPVNSQTSGHEKSIVNYIRSIYSGTVIENERTVLDDNFELDIYLPDEKLAFEFDGLYWHSELYKSNDYHLRKTEECMKKGIQLIHIFEDEWIYKEKIVKSRIGSLLGISDKIFARKCNIKEITYKESETFLDDNHIQGNCTSKYRYGLYNNEELVAVMTFGKSRFADEYELLRYCSKCGTTVIGGPSKLLSHFLKTNKNITKVITFADRRWSTGNMYNVIGFKLVGTTPVSYYYIKDGIRYNRINFQKHKINTDNSNKTEHEIMLERKIYRIYDCGNFKFEFLQE